MSANLQLYKQEVIHFLQSCTIVFSPMAAQINANLQARGIAVEPLEIFRNALASLPERDVGELLRILMKLQKNVLSHVVEGAQLPEVESERLEEP